MKDYKKQAREEIKEAGNKGKKLRRLQEFERMIEI